MADLKARKHPRLQRDFPHKQNPQFKLRAELVGEVVWAFNLAQNAFAQLFAAIIGPRGSMTSVGLATWHVLSSDQTQLDQLEAAVRETTGFGDRSQLRAKILWAIRAQMRLAKERNDVVHTPIALGHDGRLVADFFGTKPARYARWEQKDFTRMLPILTGDLYVLSQYVTALWIEYLWPGRHGPLPRRPSVRLLPPGFGVSHRPKRKRRPRPPSNSHP